MRRRLGLSVSLQLWPSRCGFSAPLPLSEHDSAGFNDTLMSAQT